MFDFIKGIVADKKKSARGCYLTIDVNDVGYSIEVSEKDFINTSTDSGKQRFYTHLVHREDIMSLFGFLHKETRDIFQILISVSGVGAKMAIALLNEFDTCDLISFVIDGNYKELTRAKGVGPKLAQKIILELKDKLIKTEMPSTASSDRIPQSQAVNDTQAVLMSLGYSSKEIDDAISKIMPTVENDSNSEEVLRKALTLLSM